jgi:hypothetical protein
MFVQIHDFGLCVEALVNRRECVSRVAHSKVNPQFSLLWKIIVNRKSTCALEMDE